jgi:predicted transcriptional regulator
MSTTLEEVDFLASSTHRAGVMEALAERACDRHDLREATGASSPTIGRVLADFEERHWIERDGRWYRLTGLGEFVAEQLAAFVDAMALERRLRDVSPWLPYGLDGFRVGLLADAVVSYPGPSYPYEPMERNRDLIDDTETIRGFGMVLLKASVLEHYFERVFDGLTVTMIYPPAVFDSIYAWNPELVADAAELDTHDVYIHDDLPNSEWCGICLTDDHLSVCCYEPDSGMIRSLVDTDAPRAYEWGESVVGRYRSDATPLDEAGGLLSVDPLP